MVKKGNMKKRKEERWRGEKTQLNLEEGLLILLPLLLLLLPERVGASRLTANLTSISIAKSKVADISEGVDTIIAVSKQAVQLSRLMVVNCIGTARISKSIGSRRTRRRSG